MYVVASLLLTYLHEMDIGKLKVTPLTVNVEGVQVDPVDVKHEP